MKIEDIKKRIEQKEKQIEKIDRRIKKFEDGKSEKKFWKDQDWLVDRWIRNNPGKTKEDYKTNFYPDYTDRMDSGIKAANRDKEEAVAQLEKYQRMLAGEEEKRNTEKIQVIVDFLNKWKEEATAYIENNMEDLNNYYQKNHEYADYYNNSWRDPDRKEKLKKLDREEKQLKSWVHPWTKECAKWERTGDVSGSQDKVVVNYEKLNEILDKEADDKYWGLVKRIEELAGNIVDARGLEIGPRGNIEGIVVGDKEKVRVETIVAGGWNAGRIVNVKKGPIRHYRTIVNVIHR